MIKIKPFKKIIVVSIAMLMAVSAFSYATESVFAQSEESQSSLYIPMIGITSIPDPMVLPDGPGSVTYHYAVKNFLRELSLTNIQIVDDNCAPVQFVEGDDNNNSILDADETWRYACTTEVSETTQSTATVTGTVNDVTSTHKARTTVVVGSDTPSPLVSIVNVTKIAYPLTLPPEGGVVDFTYRVTNPGVVPLSNVTVVDDKCDNMSSKLGDTNGNNLLDPDEVWVYTCKMILRETTTNTATVTAFSNGFETTGETSVTVTVDLMGSSEVESVTELPSQPVPSFPETGMHRNFKIIIWAVLAGILAGLVTFLFLNLVIGMRTVSAGGGRGSSDRKNKFE